MGRPAGVNTADVGTVAELRLRPGRHQLALKGAGAPDEIQEVEVQKGATCRFRIPGSESGR